MQYWSVAKCRDILGQLLGVIEKLIYGPFLVSEIT